jgi:hypothetical protein
VPQCDEINMPVFTDRLVAARLFREGGTTYRRHAEAEELRPVKKFRRTTIPTNPDNPSGFSPTSALGLQRSFESPIPVIWSPTSPDSTPLQIWEGTVLEVDHASGVMRVLLDAKMGQVPRHNAEVGLEWVSGQDEDLVRPGAVFYLTLFKRTKRGSIENSQELRFRRRPSWSPTQLKRIDEDASKLLAKMKALPLAE